MEIFLFPLLFSDHKIFLSDRIEAEKVILCRGTFRKRLKLMDVKRVAILQNRSGSRHRFIWNRVLPLPRSSLSKIEGSRSWNCTYFRFATHWSLLSMKCFQSIISCFPHRFVKQGENSLAQECLHKVSLLLVSRWVWGDWKVEGACLMFLSLSIPSCKNINLISPEFRAKFHSHLTHKCKSAFDADRRKVLHPQNIRSQRNSQTHRRGVKQIHLRTERIIIDCGGLSQRTANNVRRIIINVAHLSDLKIEAFFPSFSFRRQKRLEKKEDCMKLKFQLSTSLFSPRPSLCWTKKHFSVVASSIFYYRASSPLFSF